MRVRRESEREGGRQPWKRGSEGKGEMGGTEGGRCRREEREMRDVGRGREARCRGEGEGEARCRGEDRREAQRKGERRCRGKGAERERRRDGQRGQEVRQRGRGRRGGA